ncbi:flagellar assembly peptidoglycan hydrolase FlgJ [uncultured Aquitalea sp.]|uniref:flagellar assembly peptidoglycan hydrolase FlgJ n=1 Tax=uncultured Aquitalea sp. TaxID=540272 RepID=UPI0025FB3C43|nr:flagellar assembly peptidoglycan hydrolase FlgJ [uncultured Aquitalea sp.]
MQMTSSYSVKDAMDQQLAVDPTQTASLRARMLKDPKGAAKETAGQFEAMLLSNLMKSMRETKFDEADSSEMNTYRGMLDQQMAQAMSKGGGLGIGDMIYRQIAKQSGIDISQDPPSQHLNSSGPALGVRMQQMEGLRAYQSAQKEAMTAGYQAQGAAQDAAAQANASDGGGFARQLLPHARQAASQLGVSPEFLVAHAALESGWGKRAIKNGDGSNSHNLFGIKASGDWQGKATSVTTTEYVNGVAQKRVEKFRSYGSYGEAFSDYARLLKESPRYQSALNQGSNVYGFAQGLQSGGYATDPRYARKLVDVAASLAQRLARS